eukprot:Gb_27772 [translate_table: standard]
MKKAKGEISKKKSQKINPINLWRMIKKTTMSSDKVVELMQQTNQVSIPPDKETQLEPSFTNSIEKFHKPMIDGQEGDTLDKALEAHGEVYEEEQEEEKEATKASIEVPHSAAAGVVSVDLKSYVEISFEIYARFGSLPNLHNWDYYTNVYRAAKRSIFMTKKKGKEETNMHLNIIYPMEGIWCLGVRHFVGLSLNMDDYEVTTHVSLLGCSKQGTCHQAFEESGSTILNYCSCNQTHGGFDHSMELVFPKSHKQQLMVLIVSNEAALLPGLWSIRQKDYVEWILYTTSGISSTLHHSWDEGSWGVLSFHVLQFTNFWLSSTAVVATFTYMVAIDEKTKVAVYTRVAINTTLTATSGPMGTINVIPIAAKIEYREFKGVRGHPYGEGDVNGRVNADYGLCIAMTNHLTNHHFVQ